MCCSTVADDGDGYGDAVDGTGMSIVRALVRDELGGTLELEDVPRAQSERPVPGLTGETAATLRPVATPTSPRLRRR